MKLIRTISLFIILLDQFIKIYIKTHFIYNENLKIFSWFHLTFIENPGMAYGLEFSQGILGKIILNFIRLILIIIMIIYFNNWSKINKSLYFIIPASLILAGAIGNLIDGIFYGVIFDKGLVYDSLKKEWIPYLGFSKINFQGYSYLFQGVVVDMFRLSLFEGEIPKWVPIYGGEYFDFFKYIFNIADLSITTSVVWILIFKKKIFLKGIL